MWDLQLLTDGKDDVQDVTDNQTDSSIGNQEGEDSGDGMKTEGADIEQKDKYELPEF